MAIGLTRFWVRTLEALLLVLFLAIALLAWRLSKGPLPLDSMAPYLENALAVEDPNLDLKIGRASVSWTSLLSEPTLSVENVKVVDRQGVVAAIPSMMIRLSVSALVRGTVAPEEIILSSPSLRVARQPDGTFSLGFEPPTDQAEAAPLDSRLLAIEMISALTRPENRNNRASYLNRISITDTRLVMLDEGTGRRWLVPKASLNLERAGPDVLLSANLPVIDDEKPWSLKASGKYGAKVRSLELTVTADGFRPSGIAGLVPQLAPLSAVDLRVSGTMAAKLTLLDQAARLDALKFDLKGDNGTLTIPLNTPRTYPVRRMVAKGEISSGFDEIKLEELKVELDDERATGILVTGWGTKLNSQPSITSDILIDDLTLESLKRYWPEGVKENTRRWISNNLNNGMLSKSRFHVEFGGPSLSALALTQLNGQSVLSGISVTYMKTLPPIDGTNAVMQITPREVTMSVSEGHVVDAISGKGLRVRGGNIRMYQLGTSKERANILLDLTGDLGEVLRLINFQPLGYASSMGIDPNTAAGASKVHLDFAFPLVADLKLDQLEINATATVDGAKVANAALGQPLTDSQLTMKLDRNGMDVKGTVALADIPASITWRENFGGGAFRSRYEIDATLDNAARPLVGLGAFIFAPPYIDGPAKTHMVYMTKRDGTATIDAEADLADATVVLNQLGWRKEPGVTAKAVVSAKLVKSRLDSLSNFHITSEQADIQGSARFTGQNELKSLVLTKADAGESSVTGELERDEAGTYHLNVRGPAFNSTYFWKEMGRDEARGGEGEGEDRKKTPLEITAAFDRMWMAKEGDFRNVKLTFRQSTAGMEYVDFTSRVDGLAPFTLSLGPRDGKRVFSGVSPDGGSVMRAVGLFGDVVGGDMTLDGELLRDGSIKGRVDVKELKVVKAPVLARLLSVASFGGIVDGLSGQGISFKLLRVPFTYSNSTIKVSNGELMGSALGLTGKGTYRFADSMMDFDGTIIPAYTINKIFGNIPLIGRLLTGTERGGGVVAMTYTYRGPVATANPSVNPLAALTPGITRHIFDIFRGPKPKVSAPQTEEAAEAPATPESADKK